jgi:hypothetical protein
MVQASSAQDCPSAVNISKPAVSPTLIEVLDPQEITHSNRCLDRTELSLFGT